MAKRCSHADEWVHGPRLCKPHLQHVRPWLWYAQSSGGSPLTKGGEAYAFERRLSRYSRPLA